MSARGEVCKHCGASLRQGEIIRCMKALTAVLRRYAFLD